MISSYADYFGFLDNDVSFIPCLNTKTTLTIVFPPLDNAHPSNDSCPPLLDYVIHSKPPDDTFLVLQFFQVITDLLPVTML